MENTEKKRMMVIMAHPDDESFGIGASLAKYAAEGVDIHLLCVTGGENGTVAPELMNGYESVAELREVELRCAAEKLGLASVTMGGYRDSGMAGTDANGHPGCLFASSLDSVAAHFAQEMRRIRPHVVITHDPIGNYKHPDHIVCNQATERAFDIVGDAEALPESNYPAWQPQKLYFSTLPKKWIKTIVKFSPLFGVNPREYGRNRDIDILDLVETGDFPIHAKLNIRKYVAVRDAASACHRSQLGGGPPNNGFLGIALRLMAGYDYFMRAYPEASDGLIEQDLFEGVAI